MASFVKTKLKNARDAITQKDYAKAKDLASQVLEYEPDNYNAYVTHLGLMRLSICRVRPVLLTKESYAAAFF
jgi:superkiller protein 3